MQNVPMTKQGSDALKLELDELKKIRRPRVIQAISEAREHGDLKENAEYHAAKEEQGFIEGRIKEIEGKLSNARVIDVSQLDGDGKVIFGATITIMNLDSDDSITYQIVGEDEADIKQHKMSVTSPIARALIGKYEGDEVEINIPSGEVTYEIESVKYI